MLWESGERRDQRSGETCRKTLRRRTLTLDFKDQEANGCVMGRRKRA